MFENIPEELRKLPRWCTFDIEGNKKVPYIAGNCAKASSNTPSTWRTFEEATADIVEGRRQHLGLAISWPYFFLDLDEPQPSLMEAIDTYAQRSVSGKGIHLIGKGSFEGPGRHPKSPAVGLFQENRFCLFTANVVDDRTEIKEVDEKTLQSVHDWLSGQSSSTTTISLVETPPSSEDQSVYEAAAQRFDTFIHLWNGNAGPDHSESDHALISMLADCTDSNEQVRRMWFSCALCREHRRNDRYVNRTLQKLRAKQEELKESFMEFATEPSDSESLEEPQQGFSELGARDMIDSLPDGLIKRLADWHWKQAVCPLQECSISVAFSAIATVAGRNYQTYTNSGCNPWLILLADTSWGKDDYPKGLSSIFSTVSEANVYGQGFMSMIAAGAASGEGLEDQLVRNNRLNTYFDEFDFIFKATTTAQGSPHMASLAKLLLLLYGRSGKNGVLRRRLKARAKDEEETPPVKAPCLVVSGETIPEKLYSHMGIEQAQSGFLQRFSLFEARRDSVSISPGPNFGKEMPQDLVDDLLELFVKCDTMMIGEEFVSVEPTPQARKILDTYSRNKRLESLNAEDQAAKHIFNRAGLKAYKFSALLGISADHINPTVTEEHAEWAIQLVDYCDNMLWDRFTSGTVGTGQGQQESEIRKLLKSATTAGATKRKAMGIPENVARFRDVVPYGWLKKNMIQMGVFAGDKRGAVDAFASSLKHMVSAGEVVLIDKDLAATKYGKGAGPLVGVVRE